MKEENSQLAEKGFALAQKLLIEEYSYLAPLVYSLTGQADEKVSTMSTDGETAFYNPTWLLTQLSKGSEGGRTVMNCYLQMLCHCLLGHIWQPPQGPLPTWNSVCDLTAALLAQEFASEPVKRDRIHTRQLQEQIGLRRKLSLVEAGQLAQYAAECRKVKRQLNKLGEQVRADDHSCWSSREKSKAHAAAQMLMLGRGYGKWEELVKSILPMLPDSVKKSMMYGMFSGNASIDVAASEENKSDYRNLLRHYTRVRELRREDDDSLDYGWYSLGLRMYGNIPLIEYPESCERPKADNIVIALDVSGSCGGETARRFLRETVNMLRDVGVSSGDTDILVIECDTVIQGETRVHGPEDLESFKHKSLSGFGGTNFVPVFQRIEELRRQNLLDKPRCLLYLSDGYGSYPNTPPDYDVIFVLDEETSRENSPCPSWIKTVWLTQDDMKEE